MWLLLAFCSAALLGFYDVFKKKSLSNNAVLPVLALNTLFSSIIFIPFILLSHFAPQMLQDSIFYVPDSGGWEVHKFILLKSFIVLSSWAFGYFGMKHLPLTIVGPINATRPVMTLVGAMLIFGERLNLYQWIGVFMAVISFFMLSRSGKKEGIYNPQIQISAESETKRSIFREKDKTKRSKKESAQHSKSRNKSFVMTSVSAL